MGNKFSRRRAMVDERYTRTQGLYQHSNVDPRKLKRMILNGHLAPCFPGAEESTLDLDECPICFLFYPSLNRSKCCAKGICTECFLQIKSPHSTRPTQCPFCKTSSYLVEYRGAKTVEEKGVEQEEEQKVIEAKIRIRQKELDDEGQRTLRNEEDQGSDNIPERFRRNFSNLHGFTLPFNESQLHGRGSTVDGQDAISDVGSDLPIEFAQTSGPEIASRQVVVPQGGAEEAVLEGTACVASQTNCQRGSSFQRLNRMDDFDLDLEEIMIMEAIWLSIQEQGQTTLDHAHLPRVSNARSTLDENSAAGNVLESRTTIGRGSVTSGLAGAIAALAEMQATGSDSNSTGVRVCVDNMQGLENECSLPSNNVGCGELLNVNATSQTASVGAISINAGEKTQGNGNIENGYEIAQNKNHGSRELNNWIEVAVQNGRTLSPPTSGEGRSSTSDLLQDHSSEAVEVGTSFSSSVPSDLPWEAPDLFPPQCVENTDDSLGLDQSAMMLPDSFEEQMMLAMALSLAEAQVQAQRH